MCKHYIVPTTLLLLMASAFPAFAAGTVEYQASNRGLTLDDIVISDNSINYGTYDNTISNPSGITPATASEDSDYTFGPNNVSFNGSGSAMATQDDAEYYEGAYVEFTTTANFSIDTTVNFQSGVDAEVISVSEVDGTQLPIDDEFDSSVYGDGTHEFDIAGKLLANQLYYVDVSTYAEMPTSTADSSVTSTYSFDATPTPEVGTASSLGMLFAAGGAALALGRKRVYDRTKS